MIVLAVYIATIVSVAFLAYLAGRGRQGSKDPPDVFRYPRKVAISVLMIDVMFSIFAGLAVYGSLGPTSSRGELLLYLGVWGWVFVAFIFGYVYLQRYEIRVYGDRLVIRGFRTRIIAANEIRQLALVEGAGGRSGRHERVRLYGANHASLLTVDDSIDSFAALVAGLRELTKGGGVEYRRRDYLGKWTTW